VAAAPHREHPWLGHRRVVHRAVLQVSRGLRQEESTMLAYTWPLLNLFWTFLMFAGIALLLFFVIFCFVDNFRRRDHSGWAKAGWTVVIFLIPFLGSVIYIVARPADAQLAT
jgi:hypothetical protein